jgi:hypothetical protein
MPTAVKEGGVAIGTDEELNRKSRPPGGRMEIELPERVTSAAGYLANLATS